MDGSLAPERYVAEVVALHRFFQAWLEGSAPATDAEFARFTAATHPAFTLIGPDGTIAGRAETAAWIRAAHGTRAGFALWTDEHVVRHLAGGLAIVTYREWQRRGDATTLRLSTGILAAEPSAPGGVTWLHVHETWLGQGPHA